MVCLVALTPARPPCAPPCSPSRVCRWFPFSVRAPLLPDPMRAVRFPPSLCAVLLPALAHGHGRCDWAFRGTGCVAICWSSKPSRRLLNRHGAPCIVSRFDRNCDPATRARETRSFTLQTARNGTPIGARGGSGTRGTLSRCACAWSGAGMAMCDALPSISLASASLARSPTLRLPQPSRAVQTAAHPRALSIRSPARGALATRRRAQSRRAPRCMLRSVQ